MTGVVTRLALPLALLAAVTACSQPPAPQTARIYAFGTLVELTAYGVDEAAFAQAREQATARLQRWHERWHPWHGDGLARVNRALARGKNATVSPDLIRIIKRARALEAASGGRFNGAMGALTRLWGFHQGANLPATPPPDAAVRQWLAHRPRLADLTLQDQRIASRNPAARVDLGAIAKGIAAARIAALLGEHGAWAALVTAGGDIATHGRPRGRAWRIGVRAPRGEGLLATVSLQTDEAIFTSGDYERFFRYEGRRYHHVLDPVTGRPARGTRSVTVITDDAARADAAATALFVAGPEDWAATARRLGLTHVMLVDAQGNVHLSTAMAERVRFAHEPAPTVIEETTL